MTDLGQHAGERCQRILDVVGTCDGLDEQRSTFGLGPQSSASRLASWTTKVFDKPFKRFERGTAIFIRVTNDIGAVNQQDKMLIAVRCVSRLDQGAVRGSVLEGRVDRGVGHNVLNDIY